MAYMEQPQSGFRSLVQAGEAGRRNIDDVMGPVNGAIGDITGAADELISLPGMPPGIGEKVQRVMRGINAAQAKVGNVLSTYNQATRSLSAVDERMGMLKSQAGRVVSAINQLVGKVSPSLANILPTGALSPSTTPLVEAVKPFPHLLILQQMLADAQPFTSTSTRPLSMSCVVRPSFAGPPRSAFRGALHNKRLGRARTS